MTFPALDAPTWPDTHAALCAYAGLAAAIKAALCGDADLECVTEGVSTGPIAAGDQVFEICLALHAGQWRIRFADGAEWQRPLQGQPVRELAEETFLLLETQAAQLEIDAEADAADDDALGFDRGAATAWFEAVIRVAAICRQVGGVARIDASTLALTMRFDDEEKGRFEASDGRIQLGPLRLDYTDLRHAEDPADVLSHLFEELPG